MCVPHLFQLTLAKVTACTGTTGKTTPAEELTTAPVIPKKGKAKLKKKWLKLEKESKDPIAKPIPKFSIYLFRIISGYYYNTRYNSYIFLPKNER